MTALVVLIFLAYLAACFWIAGWAMRRMIRREFRRMS